MKNPFDVFIGRQDIAGERICELEDIPIGSIQTEMQREKGVNETDLHLQELENNIKWYMCDQSPKRRRVRKQDQK